MLREELCDLVFEKYGGAKAKRKKKQTNKFEFYALDGENLILK